MNRATSITVTDPFGIASDPEMLTLAPALDPVEAQRRLGYLAGEDGHVVVRGIRVTRYKPHRRCVIEYDVDVAERACGTLESLTLLGKVRARRFGESSYQLLGAFRDAGFGADAEDGIYVPEPVGVVPDLHMWLQHKVPGRAATALLAAPNGVELARRISEAAHKVHQAGVPTERRHTMADELRILRERLLLVAVLEEPRWAGRIQRLLDACEKLGVATPEPSTCGVHRDFYADQVIVDGDRLHLIDFDLYCEGDPALDIGNFLGHITEQSLRETGDPEAFADVEEAMEDRFVELSGEATRAAVQAYATLTLARHVQLSTLFPERRPFTGRLLELCEERLGVRC